MDIILLVRLAITLTFLMLAAGGPVCIVLLRSFIKRYMVAHEALEVRNRALEARVKVLEARMPGEH